MKSWAKNLGAHGLKRHKIDSNLYVFYEYQIFGDEKHWGQQGEVTLPFEADLCQGQVG